MIRSEESKVDKTTVFVYPRLPYYFQLLPPEKNHTPSWRKPDEMVRMPSSFRCRPSGKPYVRVPGHLFLNECQVCDKLESQPSSISIALFNVCRNPWEPFLSPSLLLLLPTDVSRSLVLESSRRHWSKGEHPSQQRTTRQPFPYLLSLLSPLVYEWTWKDPLQRSVARVLGGKSLPHK